MKSYLAKPGQVGGKWRLIDADGKILGRLAVQIATTLMGKDQPTYTPHVLSGDFVVVINAEKFRLTGRKMSQMEYDSYSYHPSGRKVVPIAEMLAKHPERILIQAVKRMLPKTKLAVQMLKRLKVYAGPSHPHQAQQPQGQKAAAAE